VAKADDVERLLAAATAAGKHAVAVEYELANGRRRTASAAIEERLRVGCRLEPRADATPAQVAVREGITRSRRAQ
jgi:hypothetical protein